jgi:hypothetical protein
LVGLFGTLRASGKLKVVKKKLKVVPRDVDEIYHFSFDSVRRKG